MSDAGTEASDSPSTRPRESGVGDSAEADEAAQLPDSDVAESPVESADLEAEPADREAQSANPEVESEIESADPSDAFEALGNEVRMAVLQALADADGVADGDEPRSGHRMTFSELFEASPVDTTAGFAYHLRQLTGQFVEKTGEENDQYALTYAGSQVARATVAGTYTDRVSFDPVPTGDPCPLCESSDLAASGEANYVTVACTDCDRAILTLPLPPGAHRNLGSNSDADSSPNPDASPGSDATPDFHASPDPQRLLAIFDRHHRHRLSVMSDGVCPECAATMDAAIARPPESVTERLPDGDAERAQVRLDCQQCGCRLHCPVTLAVLEHPAVISLFHDHALNVRDRPIWNVGTEWRETVISDDPWCVRVSAELDEEVLDLFVAGDLSIAGTRRRAADEVRQAS